MWMEAFLQAFMRQVNPAHRGELSPVPVSRVFGFDRGKPIDRHYMEAFLSANADLIRGTVLEVGGSQYTRMFARDSVHRELVLDFKGNADEHTVVADMSRQETCPEAIADCFICTHTFNFIFDVHAAARSAWKMLKPGGTLLATVAAITQISRYDDERWGDYWRFTPDSIRSIFQPIFGNGAIEIEGRGNLAAAIALLRGESVADLLDPSILNPADPDYPVVITLKARKVPPC